MTSNDYFSIIFTILLSILSMISWGVFYYKRKEERKLDNYKFTFFYIFSFLIIGYFLSLIDILFFRIFIVLFLILGVIQPIFILSKSNP